MMTVVEVTVARGAYCALSCCHDKDEEGEIYSAEMHLMV